MRRRSFAPPRPPSPAGAPPSPGLDRRRFLLVAGGAVAGVTLAACGGVTPTRPPDPTRSAAATTASGASSPPTPPPSVAPSVPPWSGRPSPIRAENLRPGDPGWDRRGSGRRKVDAYLGRASLAPGETLELRTSGPGPLVVEWYRLGWYGGAGGRLMRTDRGVASAPARKPTPDPVTGRVEAGWPVRISAPIPADWPSGMYLAVVRAGSGRAANVPIVIRPQSPGPAAARAPVLFVSAAATWQAYNGWGGKSLYPYDSKGTSTATRSPRAAIVSFDRPYLLDDGAGFLRRWELQFIRWMEREGRDVEYMTDVDLALHPDLVDDRRLVVMAGHPEYWSRPMRERVTAAIAAGTNVAFLTANEVYWQTRLEDGPAGPATRIVCYKSAALDPVTAVTPALATCRWREAPVSEPEAALVGQQYSRVVRLPSDWVVARSGHWLYQGTGLGDGDRLKALVGQEFDTWQPGISPPNVEVLARSPVKVFAAAPGKAPGEPPTYQTATSYVAPSGATVIAAGTFQWSWAIDGYGDRTYAGVKTPVDDRVRRMTQNLFDRLGDGPGPG